MPQQPQQPAKRPATAPALKPLRETLQEAVNRQTVKIAREGVAGIDTLKQRALKEIARRYGITELDAVADSLADTAKRLLIRGLSK